MKINNDEIIRLEKQPLYAIIKERQEYGKMGNII